MPMLGMFIRDFDEETENMPIGFSEPTWFNSISVSISRLGDNVSSILLFTIRLTQ